RGRTGLGRLPREVQAHQQERDRLLRELLGTLRAVAYALSHQGSRHVGGRPGRDEWIAGGTDSPRIHGVRGVDTGVRDRRLRRRDVRYVRAHGSRGAAGNPGDGCLLLGVPDWHVSRQRAHRAAPDTRCRPGDSRATLPRSVSGAIAGGAPVDSPARGTYDASASMVAAVSWLALIVLLAV